MRNTKTDRQKVRCTEWDCEGKWGNRGTKESQKKDRGKEWKENRHRQKETETHLQQVIFMTYLTERSSLAGRLTDLAPYLTQVLFLVGISQGCQGKGGGVSLVLALGLCYFGKSLVLKLHKPQEILGICQCHNAKRNSTNYQCSFIHGPAEIPACCLHNLFPLFILKRAISRIQSREKNVLCHF